MRGKVFMRKSTIYLFVLLTVFSLSLTLIPSGFSQPENVKILSYSWYIDSLGYLVVVGEVQNVGSNTVASVILGGTVYSSDGTQSDSSGQAWVLNLIPQQKAPFYIEFYSSSSSDGTWLSLDISKVDLAVYQAEATANYQYPDLKITSSSATVTSDGVYWVSGIVQNTGSQTAKNITVVGAFYNASGVVAGVGYTDPLTPASLAASGSASFKVGAFDLNQTIVPSNLKISSYSLLVQTEGPILQGTAPLISPSPSPITSPNPSGSPSATQSPDSNPTNSLTIESIYAIVIVIVILGIAGTILMLRKRKPQATKKARHG